MIKNKSSIFFFVCFIQFFGYAQNKSIEVEGQEINLDHSKNRYAFNIGVDIYDDPKIKGFTSCRLDANSFEGFLRSPEGFLLPKKNIKTLFSPGKKKIKEEFKKLINTINKPEESTLYFFYSGHGTIGKIIPSDARKEDISTFLSYSFFKDIIKEKGILAVVFIIDACNSGSIIDKSLENDFNKQFNIALQKNSSSQLQVTLTAINEYETASAGINLSLFTKHLLNSLHSSNTDKNKDGIITASEVYTEMVNKIGDAQKPVFNGNLDFPLATYEKRELKIRVFNPDSIQYWRYNKRIYEYRINLANKYLEDKEFELAAKYYNSAYTYSSGPDYYLLYQIANIYVNINNYDKALQFYLELVKTGGIHQLDYDQQNLVTKNIGLIYLEKNEFDEAINYLNEILEANPNNTNIILTRANIYLRKGMTNKFYNELIKVESIDPRNVEVLYNIGVISYDRKEYIKARKYYEKALNINPKYINALNNMAVTILVSEEAIVNEMNDLGYSVSDEKRYEELKKQREKIMKEAIPYLESSLKINSKQLQILNTLANIYKTIKDDLNYNRILNLIDE